MKRFAIVGNPNCGKTALFNLLTGGKQKVGNYPGVTVEKKEGILKAHSDILLIDLPGSYSLTPRTPDEEVTEQILKGSYKDEPKPDALIVVVDSTLLERSLGFVLELKALGYPMVLALNMSDLAEQLGIQMDLKRLSQILGCPVVSISASKKTGIEDLIQLGILGGILKTDFKQVNVSDQASHQALSSSEQITKRFREVEEILKQIQVSVSHSKHRSWNIDRFVLHPFYGFIIFLILIAVIFESVFSLAAIPQDWIESGIQALSGVVSQSLGEGILRDLLVEGVLAGIGGVIVFLPQILILFFFTLLLEDIGYMARAAFLTDKLMSRLGLHGRAFIPLLSSYACAIPGVMATRTIENKRDRLTTILVAPLMTCSARLPVYSLLIAAFIPDQRWGFFHYKSLTLIGLYGLALASALIVAWILKQTLFKTEKPIFMMEMPSYKKPSFSNILVGMKERAWLFVRNAGTIIFSVSVLLWFATSFPKQTSNTPSEHPAIYYSYAGQMGRAIEPLIQPLGFDWRVGIAFIPGLAAREVMVSALSTVYAVEAKDEEEGAIKLGEVLKQHWTLATALSLLVWYVYACQCLSTIAVVKRETNSWGWTGFMLLYTTALAYGGAWLTYRIFS